MHLSDQQGQVQEKSQIQLKQVYWQKWIQWVQMVRHQRYNAAKMLDYQSLLENRLLTKTFQAWVQVHQQQKFEQLLKLKHSFVEPGQQPEAHYDKVNQDDFGYKMTLAIKFYQRKTYAKCINAWISYGIVCNKFQQNISKVYIKFLLQKYLDIIREFKCKSKEKKTKKSQTAINESAKMQDLSQNAQSQLNFVTPAHLISQIDKFPATAQNFRQLLHQNPTFKKSQRQQPQANTSYNGFQRNPILGDSRRSQFSTLSAQQDYNSKRKFRPITQLPSIPDIENMPKGLKNNLNIKHEPRSPVKSYRGQGEQHDPMQIAYSVSNLQEQNFEDSKENAQKRVKHKILEVLIKEKLLTLAIMKGDEFEEGLQFENYRQKTINSLRKLKDCKMR